MIRSFETLYRSVFNTRMWPTLLAIDTFSNSLLSSNFIYIRVKNVELSMCSECWEFPKHCKNYISKKNACYYLENKFSTFCTLDMSSENSRHMDPTYHVNLHSTLPDLVLSIFKNLLIEIDQTQKNRSDQKSEKID